VQTPRPPKQGQITSSMLPGKLTQAALRAAVAEQPRAAKQSGEPQPSAGMPSRHVRQRPSGQFTSVVMLLAGREIEKTLPLTPMASCFSNVAVAVVR
jgi:hypothetical protein